MTEDRHPLSDRQLLQGDYLYGVRFGTHTSYCVLDIDRGSVYHPRQDVLAIPRLVAALETLGLVDYVACSSSHSGGLHLYFPFPQAQRSWQVAAVVALVLERAGFKLVPGQLELFPNPKPYQASGKLSLFNGHRLPLQMGSYLVNQDWEPIWSDRHTFVDHWQQAQARNFLSKSTLERTLKQARTHNYRLSGKAEKFLHDLNAEIETGWTGSGQTNRLLGRIALRTYIFHHLLVGGKPLAGEALVAEIVSIARALPGYREWCSHQHEIEQRAGEWAVCVEKSHYFPYGIGKGKYKQAGSGVAAFDRTSGLPSWNQRQSHSARERIRLAIADLLDRGQLPATVTARFQALLSYQIGGATLYRHRDLWHPTCLESATVLSPEALKEEVPLDCAGGASNQNSPPSLLPENGSNIPDGGLLSDRSATTVLTSGSNSSAQDPELTPPSCDRDPPAPGSWIVQQVLAEIRTRSAQKPTVTPLSPTDTVLRQQRLQRAYEARMQAFWESGDPILMAEARDWIASRQLPGSSCLEISPQEEQTVDAGH